MAVMTITEEEKSHSLALKTRLLRGFDSVASAMKKVIAFHYTIDFAEATIKEARQEFEALIPQIPYLGSSNDPLTKSLVGALYYLALYRVLRKHGETAVEVGKLTDEITEVYLASLPWLSKTGLRLFWRLMFTWLGRKIIARQAAASQKRRCPEGFVYRYVKGEGRDFDFGMDVVECGICKFFQKQGDDEFTPFICHFDFPISRLADSGLVRTLTLAEGNEKCDFRYKRGRNVLG